MFTKGAARGGLDIAGRHTHGTLLPFLYHTRSIRRAHSDQLNLAEKAGLGQAEEQKLREIKDKWSSKKPSLPRTDHAPRSDQRRPRKDESTSVRMQRARQRPKTQQSIPFEGDTGFATPAERLQKTTMTPREMQVFEELFRKGIERKKKYGQDERHTPTKPNRRVVKPAVEPQFPELLKPLAEEAAQLRQRAARDAAFSHAGETAASSVGDFEIKDEQAVTIRKLMDQAKTDMELWEVLRDHVLQRLRETPDHAAMQSNFSALPALLQHYMHLQTDVLPSTHSLGLVALSELKRIGPAAFALGATTKLYNQHMRLLWRQYRDMDEISRTLEEMDREVYHFDGETQELIHTMLDHAHDALRGKLGNSVRELWTMDRKMRGVAKIKKWKKIIDERMETQALDQARGKHVDLDDDRDHDDIQSGRSKHSRVAFA